MKTGEAKATEKEIRGKAKAVARILEGITPNDAANVVCAALNEMFIVRYGRVATIVYCPTGSFVGKA
jgi:hypothetical protein